MSGVAGTALRRPGPAAQGHLAMVGFSALVAGSFSLGAMVANDISPSALTAARFLVAALVLGAVVLAGPGFRRAHLRAPWRFVILGGTIGFYFVLMFEGLKTASAVSTAAVFTLTPVMTALFGWWFLRQVTTPRMAFALAIGAAGALWVIFRADLGALIAFEVGYGEAVYFVGCIAHSAFTPLLRRFNRGEPATVTITLVMVAGFVLLALFGWSDVAATDWTALSPLVWITLFYTAILASAATFFLLQFAALRLPSAKVMAYTYLTPAWIILWELALGQGVPGVMVLPGIALIVLALVMLLRQD